MKAHQSLTEAMFAVAKADLPEHITSVAVHVLLAGVRPIIATITREGQVVSWVDAPAA